MENQLNHKFILASSSPYRAKLLKKIVQKFEQRSPDINEEDIHNSSLDPYQQVEKLSTLKGQKIIQSHPECIVLAGDQMAVQGDQILNKPGNRKTAIEQLSKLVGENHSLLTGHWLGTPDNPKGLYWLVETKLTMHPLTLSEIESYIDQDQPFDCAGSYKIEENGIGLFSKIETIDFTAIEGLSLLTLNNRLRDLTRKKS